MSESKELTPDPPIFSRGESEQKESHADPLKPYRTSDRTVSLCIDGYLMPWDPETDQPYFIHVVGDGPKLYLQVFSTVEKLRTGSLAFFYPDATIKKIDEQWEFLASIPREIEIMIDPFITAEGRVRYQQILRD